VSTEADYTLRPYKAEDLNFIQNSWGSSYYKGADYTDFMSPQEFNKQHRPIRENILKRPTATAIIACDAKDEDLILGWILIEKPKTSGLLLHYLYVKEAFKGEGVADALLNKTLIETPILVTHMTDKARKILRKKKDDFKNFFYAPDTIMIRDSYLSALPKDNQ
jgi:hypothetical protein